MRGFLILAILLAFPTLEIFTLMQLANRFGWWLLAWLLFAALWGVLLIREAGLNAPLRLLAALQSGHPLGVALLHGFVPVAAGILLIFPGVISDALAMLLLLLPLSGRKAMPPAANDDVIEGEWHRTDEPSNHDRLR
ncbi:MAG: FxsA family protein [Sulfuricella sp.]|nr:FxsA family protein [Sulfuricella sp.]